jgi:hypothetical protein
MQATAISYLENKQVDGKAIDGTPAVVSNQPPAGPWFANRLI